LAGSAISSLDFSLTLAKYNWANRARGSGPRLRSSLSIPSAMQGRMWKVAVESEAPRIVCTLGDGNEELGASVRNGGTVSGVKLKGSQRCATANFLHELQFWQIVLWIRHQAQSLKRLLVNVLLGGILDGWFDSYAGVSGVADSVERLLGMRFAFSNDNTYLGDSSMAYSGNTSKSKEFIVPNVLTVRPPSVHPCFSEQTPRIGTFWLPNFPDEAQK
ncbi:hypothetical protein CPC08DRAFT_804978, partial [Agrocybe pediades]